MIDLRSDTVTQPCEAMRQAMAAAPVGDDQFGEDPSINHLQERMAEMLGQEEALWMPSGTMANQVALRTLTQPGDDVLVTAGAHVLMAESGAGAANAGVQFTALGGDQGYFDADAMSSAVKPRDHIILPPTTLVTLENTHNMAGGVVVPQEVLSGVARAAQEAGLASYLDGARLWNAAAAVGAGPAELSAGFDLVWVAFSKGLGAPGGSMLAGPRHLIHRARRFRRIQGGAMRQVGIFAAAAEHALDYHQDDFAIDHANARAIAETLAASPLFDVDLDRVQTNIVIFGLAEGAVDASTLVAHAGAAGVAVLGMGERIRAVTHRDVSTEECLEAARTLVRVAGA